MKRLFLAIALGALSGTLLYFSHFSHRTERLAVTVAPAPAPYTSYAHNRILIRIIPTTVAATTTSSTSSTTTTLVSRPVEVPQTYVRNTLPVQVARPRPAAPTSPVTTKSFASASGWSPPWACIAERESGGNPAEDTGNGFYGGLQFTLQTWRAYGGTGWPQDASIATQEAVADRVLASAGWGAWPNTSRLCGYR